MRAPTAFEMADVLQYLSEDDVHHAESTLETAKIGVFDNYISDGPGYVGRVIVVIYSGDPSFHDILCYDRDGKLYRVVSEREFHS